MGGTRWPLGRRFDTYLMVVGNYEEGFGKERHKNKWNGPNSKMELTSGGQMVTVGNGVVEKVTTQSSATVVEAASDNTRVSIENGESGNSSP